MDYDKRICCGKANEKTETVFPGDKPGGTVSVCVIGEGVKSNE